MGDLFAGIPSLDVRQLFLCWFKWSIRGQMFSQNGVIVSGGKVVLDGFRRGPLEHQSSYLTSLKLGGPYWSSG